MKLTILGNYGPYPKSNGNLSGYAVEDNDFLMLLDMGSGTLSKFLSEFDINKLDAIFISHLHFDHTSDLLPFRYLLDTIGKKITVFTEFSDTEYYKILFNHPLIDCINVGDKETIEYKGRILSFYRMKHGAPTLGIKIKGEKTFFYMGDTAYFDELDTIISDADIVLADCAQSPDFRGGHMTVEQGINLAKTFKNTKFIFTHLSPNYEIKEILPDNAEIATLCE